MKKVLIFRFFLRAAVLCDIPILTFNVFFIFNSRVLVSATPPSGQTPRPDSGEELVIPDSGDITQTEESQLGQSTPVHVEAAVSGDLTQSQDMDDASIIRYIYLQQSCYKHPFSMGCVRANLGANSFQCRTVFYVKSKCGAL